MTMREIAQDSGMTILIERERLQAQLDEAQLVGPDASRGETVRIWAGHVATLRQQLRDLDSQEYMAGPEDPQVTLGAYAIIEGNMPILIEKLAKLNRRAERLHLQPIKVVKTGSELRPTGERDAFNEPVMARFTNVEVCGATPRLNGWVFAATLQHEAAGTIVRTFPLFNAEIPASYRAAIPFCDHCQQVRQRLDTYIVFNVESSEFKQVGSSCLQDFTRYTNPQAIAAWLSDIQAFLVRVADEDDEMWGGSGMRQPEYMDTTNVVALSVAMVEAKGWLSKTKASEMGGVPTASRMQDWMWGRCTVRNCYHDRDCADGLRRSVTVNESHKETAAQVLDWVRAMAGSELDDYKSNLLIACGDETNRRNLGIVASAYPVWKRIQDQQREELEQATRPESNWIGEVGQRPTLTLKVVDTKAIVSDFGGVILVSFEDADGNRLKWFCTGALAKDDQGNWIGTEQVIGKTWKVKGTIKKHDQYRGRKETLMNRCVLTAAQEATNA